KVINGLEITSMDYLGGFHYENTERKFFPTTEGYVNATKNGNQYNYNYVYNYTDHLGNIRLRYTYTDPILGGGNLRILEENHYYPFGLKHKKYGSVDYDFVELEDDEGYYESIEIIPPGARKTYQYKYNGKEFQDELGLNWYSYGFRMYDPALGRFPSMDPISSQFPHVSPYNYAENEPVSSIDLWGLQRWIVNGRERNNPMPKWRTNARTAGFAIRHPKAAYKIGTGGRGSTDITGVAGRYARHFAESTGTSKAIGSKSNALRHVIWSSAIRSEFDAGISKRATNAHEGVGIAENQSVDFSKTFNGKGDDGLNLADHIVDVLNNEIGFSLAESNPDATI